MNNDAHSDDLKSLSLVANCFIDKHRLSNKHLKVLILHGCIVLAVGIDLLFIYLEAPACSRVNS